MRPYRRAILAMVALCSFFLVGNLTFFRKSSSTERAQAKSAGLSDELPETRELPAVHEDSCSYDPSCPPPRILFRLHAETANSPPFACLNDVRLFDGEHLEKGVNLVSLNGSSGDVESSVSFDVAASDGELINWLRLFHSHSIMVCMQSKAVSMYLLGMSVRINMTEELSDIQRIDPEKMAALGGGSRNADQNVELGPEWKWCGMAAPCGPDEISMHFFTGEHKDDWPRLCVGGRMVFDHGLNGAGRGLNLVSIEPKTGRVSSVAHFDTYQDGIFFTFIHRLMTGSMRYFVGHKGLAAYTPFEDLNIPTGNNWAKPIKASICLPKKLDTWRGRSVGKAGSSRRPLNLPRRHFCLKHDRHGEFCSESHIDDLIRPRALLDRARVGDPVFNMPIVIAAGLSTDSLRICLESLMEQEGLNTQMIIVVYDKLINISLILSALSAAFAVFPSATTVAVM
ncbi:hypothetical protein COOONC_05362 [Cooperia oncophora]